MENQNTPVEEKNTAAVIALVLGIVSLVGALIIPFIGWLIAIVCGIIGIIQAGKGRKIQTKKGMATAGLVCSIIGVCFGGLGAICTICACALGNAVDAGINSIINSGL